MNKNYKEIEEAFRIHAMGRVPVDNVPDGWYTSESVSKILKMPKRKTERFISEMVKNSTAKVNYYRIKTGNGLVRKIPHYNFNGKAKKKIK